MPGLPKTDRMEWWPRANVRLNPNNVRRHSAEQVSILAAGMRKAWTFPCLVAEDVGKPQNGMLIAGEGRYLAALEAGYDEQVKVLVAENWTPEMIDQYTIFDNRVALLSTYDEEAFQAEILRILDAHGATTALDLGFDQDALDAVLNPQPARSGVKGSLADAFGVPPFSVLVAREGWWQNRKKLWLGLGIKSEVGRGDHVEPGKSHRGAPKGGGRLYGGQRAGGGFAQQVKYGGKKK